MSSNSRLPYAQLLHEIVRCGYPTSLAPFCCDHLVGGLVGLGRMEEAEALWIHFDCANVDDLDGHGQIRLLLQRGLAAEYAPAKG